MFIGNARGPAFVRFSQVNERKVYDFFKFIYDFVCNNAWVLS